MPRRNQREAIAKANQEILALKEQVDALREAQIDPEKPPFLEVAAKSVKELNATNIKPRRVLKGHFGKIYALHWSQDSQKIVSASQDGKLIIWNGFTTNKVHAIALRSSWVMTCAYSPSGQLVACGGLDNLCTVYTISDKAGGDQSNKSFAELAQHDGYLSCCRFVSDEEIVTSSGDSTCILWDVKTRTPKSTFAGHETDVMSVALYDDKDTNVFVSGSCDAKGKVWDFRMAGAQNCVGTYEGHESDINSVAWFPDGNAFATGSDDSSARLFDLRAYRQVHEYRDHRILCGITSIAFSHSGQMLFAGNDETTCHIWDTRKGTILSTLDKHDNRVSCLGVSANGQALCTGSWDTVLRIFA